jgi:hypothetical protein
MMGDLYNLPPSRTTDPVRFTIVVPDVRVVIEETITDGLMRGIILGEWTTEDLREHLIARLSGPRVESAEKVPDE